MKDFLDANYDRLFGEPEEVVDATPAGTTPETVGGAAAPSDPLEPSAAGVAAGAGAGAAGEAGLASPGALSAEAEAGPTRPGALSAAAVRECRLVGLYGGLLGPGRNFFTRRQSLKLLAELLLDRTNFSVMMRFISSRHNLKTMMTLLIDKSKNIQFEAFHVFKVFVANPRKPPEIVAALVRNKARLVGYLETFHADRNDPQFMDEKALIIDTLGKLQAPPSGT